MAITIGVSTHNTDYANTTAGINTQSTGSSFIVVVSGEGSAVTGVTDNKGNTYSPLGTAWADTINSFQFRGRAFICLNGAGGTGHTFTQAGASFPTIYVAEIKSTSALSIENQDFATAATATSAPVNLGSATASASSIALGLFAGTGISATVTYSFSNGYTEIVSEGSVNYWNGGICYLIPGSSGSQSTTVTATGGSASLVGGMLILKESATGAAFIWLQG